MSATCPACGAIGFDEVACEARFHEGQQLEFQQPDFGVVHHLSVPSYMLQHNRYSRRGWIAVRTLLQQFVHDGLTPERARRMLTADLKRKDWSLTRGEKLASVASISWSLTVADVRLDSAADYCGDVRRWAAAVLADSAHLPAD